MPTGGSMNTEIDFVRFIRKRDRVICVYVRSNTIGGVSFSVATETTTTAQYKYTIIL